MTDNGKSMVPAPESTAIGLVRPVATAADIVDAHKQVTELIKVALVDGEDYGLIPGAGDKPSLLKPGAERLAIAFGSSPRYEIVEREVDHDRPVHFTKRSWRWGEKRGEKIWETKEGDSLGLYRYVVRCSLVRPDGRVLGEGVGTCSTMEAKYIDAPRNAENTVAKMAQKRALVAAVLNAFGLSNRFTQDVEEMDTADKPVASSTVPQSSRPAPSAAEYVPPPAAEPPKPANGFATIAQKRRFFADARTRLGWSDAQIKVWLEGCGVESTSSVSQARMSELIAELEKIHPQPVTET